MPGTSIVNDELSLDEKYRLLGNQIRSLLNKGENILSNLANFTAALKQTFNKISWIGFYLYDGEKLFVGPYQGKVACTIIEIGKGYEPPSGYKTFDFTTAYGMKKLN